MAWQEIELGEVDANSPVSAILMAKIRNNLYWFFQQFCKITLFNNTDVSPFTAMESLNQSNQWQTIKTIKIYAPDFVKTIKTHLRAKITGGTNRQMRIYEPASGNHSDLHNFASTDYEEFALTLEEPASGLIELEIQARASFSTPPDCYLHWLLSWVHQAK